MPDADPIAGDARLRHFEQGIADPVMIANAHFGIRQSLDCKILSAGLELASSRRRCGRFSVATRFRVAGPHLPRVTAPSF
jgi:hypothetical protein